MKPGTPKFLPSCIPDMSFAYFNCDAKRRERSRMAARIVNGAHGGASRTGLSRPTLTSPVSQPAATGPQRATAQAVVSKLPGAMLLALGLFLSTTLLTAGPSPVMQRPLRLDGHHKRGPGNCIKAPARLRSVSESQAVSAILGEASNQGPSGMLAVACAIRNRGTLQGVYGVNNPIIATASPALRAQALNAWRLSERNDITGGAAFWGNEKDVRTAKFYSRLQFTCKIGDHYFFRNLQAASRI